jgi:mono/diheme cytochrome c family protein
VTNDRGSRFLPSLFAGNQNRVRGVALRLSATAAAVALAVATVSTVQITAAASTSTAQDCSAFGVAGCDAQGAAGAVVYANNCALCHGDALQGVDGPPLMGPRAAVADFRTAGRLYQMVSTQMPEDVPGSLSEREYLDVVAFLLFANGVHPGGAISPDMLESVNLR